MKFEQKLVLDGSVLPAPTICVESSPNSGRYNCGEQAQLGKKTSLEFQDSANFRIDSIWLGYAQKFKPLKTFSAQFREKKESRSRTMAALFCRQI